MADHEITSGHIRHYRHRGRETDVEMSVGAELHRHDDEIQRHGNRLKKLRYLWVSQLGVNILMLVAVGALVWKC